MASTDIARIERLMTLATGDEKHDKSAHSTLDVLWVLYDRVLRFDPENPRSEERDRFVLSKGHGPEAFYAILVAKGFFPASALYPVRFGELIVVKQGKQATVIAVGPMLASVLPAVEDMDVTVLYCTTVAPFDGETLRAASQSSNIVIVEPYYEGVLVPDVCAAMKHTPIRVETIGIPHKVLAHYGEPEEHDEELGLTPRGIRRRIERFLTG